MTLTIGSLFSGIGGLEYGLELTGGFRTIWQCEIDRYASAVLRKYWPDCPNLGDIKLVDWATVGTPDVLCGGFPCQDISVAGKGAGIKEGTRSGLWSEFAKAIGILRPRYVVIENVPMLANRGLDIVLADIAKEGYDAEWHNISAASVGAWHKRERIFIIAYANRTGNNTQKPEVEQKWAQTNKKWQRQPLVMPSGCGDVPDTDSNRLQGCEKDGNTPKSWEGIKELVKRQHRSTTKCIWKIEPDVGRVANGAPSRVDRIKCLGNAVVPQVAQVVGEMILEMEAER
jgi:DNA (cytosine-5)-methyltransferase 1